MAGKKPELQKKWQLIQFKGYIGNFFPETISMRPLSASLSRAAVPTGSEEDLEATVSYTSSDEGGSDPPVLQQLAVALLAWQPALVATYARLDQAAPELAPFAAFLARLDREVGRQTGLRGEVIGWLQALAGDDGARRRALAMVASAGNTGTALATYQAIRTMRQ